MTTPPHDQTAALAQRGTPRMPTSPQPSVRIREVAELAEVSVGTVSNTINHPERVHPRTRTIVQAAIARLGFVPNQQARVLTGASSQIIGLVVLDVASPFYMETAHAVERAAREAGHVVMLCNSEGEPAREAELLRMLAAQRVRGVVLAPAGPRAHDRDEALHPSSLPLVLLDSDEDPDECSVSVDNVAGARLAVEHLLELGHRRIAFISGPSDIRQFAQRALGARQAILEAGLDPEQTLIELSVPGIGIQDGQHAAELLVAQGVTTAVFCGNDMLAFGVYRGLAQAGLRVPEDVAIVGYDDIDFAKDWVVPISSVRQPISELGYRAAQLLLEHSSGDENHVHRQIVLHPELVVRHSSDRRLPA